MAGAHFLRKLADAARASSAGHVPLRNGAREEVIMAYESWRLLAPSYSRRRYVGLAYRRGRAYAEGIAWRRQLAVALIRHQAARLRQIMARGVAL